MQMFILIHNGLCSTNLLFACSKSYSTPSLLLHVCVGGVLKRNWQERWTEFRKFEAMLHVSFSNALFMSHTVWCYACVQYQDVPGSKWWLLSNILARVGKTGETEANYNNSRPWIGLFQDVKYNNVPKCNLEFA